MARRFFLLGLLTVAGLLFLSCASPSCHPARRVSPPSDLTALACRFVDAMAAGDFDLATKNFTRKMQRALPATELKSDWEEAIKERGAYKGRIGIRALDYGDGIAIFIKCDFEERDRIYKIVFNQHKRICGLWYLAPSEDVEYEPIED